MKMDFDSFKSRLTARNSYEPFPAADFGADVALTQTQKRQMWRPVVVGGLIAVLFVVGLLIFAAIAEINGAVVSQGVVRVESNRQTMRHQDGGIVRQILIKEGQRVRAQQPLILFDNLQPQAQVDVLQSQEDSLLAQRARFEAELTKARRVNFPPSLLARQSDPRVASLIQTQTSLFASRLMFLEGQTAILNQRVEQLDTRNEGLKIQIASIDEQIRLTEEELSGYRTLNERGYAPKNLLLRYERTLADLRGRRGSLMSDVTRTNEQKGETRLQLVTMLQERQTEAAEGLRDSQARLADVSPRLTAAKEILQRTTVRSPVDGFVLNLTQHTIGGVAAPGEVLMDIVPANAPLIVTARVRPDEIDSVAPGMRATLRLTAYASRRLPALDAVVINVSADRLVDERSGEAYFAADLKVEPRELAKLGPGVKLTPGMPVETMVMTGERTIISYLIDPIVETFGKALREP